LLLSVFIRAGLAGVRVTFFTELDRFTCGVDFRVFVIREEFDDLAGLDFWTERFTEGE
jgi:hypothetical protein